MDKRTLDNEESYIGPKTSKSGDKFFLAIYSTSLFSYQFSFNVKACFLAPNDY